MATTIIAATTPYLYLAYIGLVAFAVTIALIVITYRSNFNKDRKLLMYILSIFFTPIAVILLIAFKMEKR
jgi:hypothetical protein